MAKKVLKFAGNTGMMLVFNYLALLAVNWLVLYIAHLWFPQNIVLGNASLSAGWAMCLSMSKLALIGTLAIPFFHQWEINRSKTLSPQDWMMGYFVLNFIGLWLITRFSHIYGLGVTSWVVVALMALVLDMAQGMVMMKLEKWRES